MDTAICSGRDLFDEIAAAVAVGASVDELERKLQAPYGCHRAVMVIDSTGFTRMTESHGIVHCLALLCRARSMLAPILMNYGAMGLRFEADNMYAEFAGPQQALDAAQAAQMELYRHPLPMTEHETYSICVGIGYGQFLRSAHEGLFGQEMNLASKLGEDIAGPWEILLTGAAHAALPESRQVVFEERFLAVSGMPIPYFWVHCGRQEAEKQ